MKIGVIGDLHLRPLLGYADYISDKREEEKRLVLQQIIDTFKDHDYIVFMGDCLNARTNAPSVIKSFVDLVESFPADRVIIISGNHERLGNGTTALDFLSSVRRPWSVCTNGVCHVPMGELECLFIPYQTKLDWNVKTDEEAAQLMVKEATQVKSDIIFMHHAVEHDSMKGISTDLFNEPVLDSTELFKMTDMIVIGHIHSAKLIESNGKTFLRTGSIFNQEVNETSKSIWTIEVDEQKNKKVIEHVLTQRGIYKLVNPTIQELDAIAPYNIVKVVVTDRSLDVLHIKEACEKRFDGSFIIENYASERTEIDMGSESKDYSVETMLKKYAEAKDRDPKLLLHGYELIR